MSRLGTTLEDMAPRQRPAMVDKLAEAHGLTTADRMPQATVHGPDAQWASEGPKQRDRWDNIKKLAFNALEPAAVCIVATTGPVSVVVHGRDGERAKRFGHNRGIWPARVAKTTAWKDTVTATYNKSPFFWLGTVVRIWLPTDLERDRLAEALVGLLAAISDEHGGLLPDGVEMLHDFVDIGPEIDLEAFEMEIHAIAERLGLGARWDDDGLSVFLDRVVRDAERRSNSAVPSRALLESTALGLIGRA